MERQSVSSAAGASAPASSSAAPAAAAASTPVRVSTSDIAARVISDAEGDGPASSAAALSSAAAEPTAASPDPDPDDFDAQPVERVDALGRKRENAIPHSRVQKMIAKKQAQAEQAVITQIAQSLGISKAEAELKLDDITGALTERSTKMTDYEARLKVAEQVDHIMATDPDRLIQMLAQADPRYARFAKVLEAAASAAATQVDDDPEPQPDYDLGNGQMTYSLEGMRKRDAWKERQIEKKLLGKLDEKLSPYEQERQQRETAQRRDALTRDASAAINARLTKARQSWPQFTEHEDAIATAITQNPQLTLEDAYMQVVMPKLAADRQKLWQEFIAEQNKHPHSTSATTAAAATAAPTDGKPKSTADIARRVMASMK